MNPQLVFRVVREITDLLSVYPELGEDETLRSDTLEGETDINNILAKLVQEREAAYAMAEGVKAPVNDLRERKARLERRGDGYGEAIERVMAAAGLSKVMLPNATISVSQAAPSVVIKDEDAIPERFVRIKREIDKAAINAAVKAGEEIPGVVVGNGGQRLMVRVK
ncbi:siphovirus Gp157 family protein [Bosea sp. (in: a-proteobacteria)]|uniref:siphovirus Gp157 family protein n=1 Tax=Bosea sp. (in: a-proteobacteria) TaxID=1871050 RepID=UPI0026333269|nr:siphovirus Gp157 family protein [Bosea sp. (in: a-proteobacteria)]MCO5092633.1 siphovirus Gp157 family protein [Bosea sp. (in: a-proteobacteria)]